MVLPQQKNSSVHKPANFGSSDPRHIVISRLTHLSGSSSPWNTQGYHHFVPEKSNCIQISEDVQITKLGLSELQGNIQYCKANIKPVL